MKYIAKMMILSVIALFMSQVAVARMQPIKRDGRYYYSEEDTHEHINLKKALSFLGRKMLNPQKWIEKAMAYRSPGEKQEKIDPIALLNPTQSVPVASSIEPVITWVGHATFLIQINGFNILTDPVFGSVKVGPFTLSKRVMPAGIKLEDLPHIDAIVLSHNHPDHTDADTLKFLAQKYQSTVFVPEGNKALVQSMGFERVLENNWWDAQTIIKDGRCLTISCLPAYHWSIRFSLDGYRRSLWSSWMISSPDSNIYFAGDTAYGKHFKEIAAEYPQIDIALMPIGPTSEKENKHKHSHVDALEAVDAFIDLSAQTFIPMHYGTFSTRPDSLINPIKRLNAYWQENAAVLGDKQLLMARCGQGYQI